MPKVYSFSLMVSPYNFLNIALTLQTSSGLSVLSNWHPESMLSASKVTITAIQWRNW